MFIPMLVALALQQSLTQQLTSLVLKNKPKILIVGFYHFANPKLDLVKADLDDHLSPKRQAEIAIVVEHLAKFKPTKIAVEEPFGSSDTNERYTEWLAGRTPLAVGESEQVGFRLAKQFGHSRLFPIDYRLNLDFQPTMDLAKSMPEKQAELGPIFATVQGMVNGLKNHTVLENLRLYNDPDSDRIGNGIYLRLASVVKDNQHPGADLAGDWWKRNITWIANLSTVANPGDRVLVICGGSHASLIRSILRDSIDMEVVPVSSYLR